MLHCYTGGRELAMKAISLGLVDFVHGNSDLQEIAGLARSRRRTAGRSHHGRDRRAISGARQISRQAQRAVLRRRNRQGAGGDARAFRCDEISRQTTENFFRLFTKVPPPESRGMTLTLTILGCGSSAGVPRPALGWGACDPNNPKNRRRRCSLLVERASEQRHHAGRDRYLARPARAVDRRQCRSHRRGVSDPRTRRPDPRDRRSPLGRAASAPAHSGLSESSRPPRISCCGFPIASSRRRAATIRRSWTAMRSRPAKAGPSKGRAVR